MKILRDIWWVGVIVSILYPLTQLARGVHLSWGFELGLLALLLVVPTVFAVQGVVANLPQGRAGGRQRAVRAPRQPIQWPPAMLMATYVFGGLALLSILVFALSGNASWLKAAILLGLTASATGFTYWKGNSFLPGHWKEVWLFLSLVWVVWVAGFGFQSWKELILPILTFTFALIVVLGVTEEVAGAIGTGIVWVFREIGRVLSCHYGAIPGVIGYWILCIIGVFAFAGSNPALAQLFGALGGVMAFILLYIVGKRMADRATAR